MHQAELLFTDNETNPERLFGNAQTCPYVKDAFHDIWFTETRTR